MEFKTQKDLFKYVRDSRPHKCELSGQVIQEPQAFCFAHVLGKGMYKRFKFDPNNIILVSSIEHHRQIDRLAARNKYIIEAQLRKGVKVTVKFLLSMQREKNEGVVYPKR